ncbi:hypothetical protein ABKN59_005960 [Abortiporus biennis]
MPSAYVDESTKIIALVGARRDGRRDAKAEFLHCLLVGDASALQERDKAQSQSNEDDRDVNPGITHYDIAWRGTSFKILDVPTIDVGAVAGDDLALTNTIGTQMKAVSEEIVYALERPERKLDGIIWLTQDLPLKSDYLDIIRAYMTTPSLDEKDKDVGLRGIVLVSPKGSSPSRTSLLKDEKVRWRSYNPEKPESVQQVMDMYTKPEEAQVGCFSSLWKSCKEKLKLPLPHGQTA